MKPIRDYLDPGALPGDRIEAKRIKFRASRYTIVGGILYKRAFSQPLLVDLPESRRILEEVHAGATHPGARTFAHKILQLGYFP